MLLKGQDGKMYRVWQQSGKGMNKMTLASPAEPVKEGTETAADIDKKIEFHKQGQAAAQYKGSMNKMHAAKIRELEAKKKQQGVAEGTQTVGHEILGMLRQVKRQGDDAMEELYSSCPLLAQYWDQYEGDFRSMVVELSPKTLDRIKAEIAAFNQQGVSETRVGNRMSDIEIGSPKIVHYKGKAVGEVGIDHEASPGNGQYYMKHYLTGKDMVGYNSKREALEDLKHLVMQHVSESTGGTCAGSVSTSISTGKGPTVGSLFGGSYKQKAPAKKAKVIKR
jgi:hypothetical protein